MSALGELPEAERPGVLVSQSGAGWYGFRGDERLDESAPAGDDFLAQLSVDWEAEARRAEELGVRVVVNRTGMVLSDSGGALEKMLPFFKAGIGGPVAGGNQYVPWVHLDDVVGAILFELDTEAASGPINLTAPEPATNRELSKALGRVLKRPAFAPVPALAVKALYGDMASIVTTGQRAVPARLEELGYRFRRPDLEAALRDATGSRPRGSLTRPSEVRLPSPGRPLTLHHVIAPGGVVGDGPERVPDHAAHRAGRQVAGHRYAVVGHAGGARVGAGQGLALHSPRRRAAQLAGGGTRPRVGQDAGLELGEHGGP